MRKQTFNYFFLALSMSDVIVLISALMVFVLPAVAEILDWLRKFFFQYSKKNTKILI